MEGVMRKKIFIKSARETRQETKIEEVEEYEKELQRVLKEENQDYYDP